MAKSAHVGRVCLIHWNEAEAEPRVERLRAAGFDAMRIAITGPGASGIIRKQQPSALVIDLSRLPSHGREIGLHLRRQKTTRHVPLVFVEGEPEKVARIR